MTDLIELRETILELAEDNHENRGQDPIDALEYATIRILEFGDVGESLQVEGLTVGYGLDTSMRTAYDGLGWWDDHEPIYETTRFRVIHDGEEFPEAAERVFAAMGATPVLETEGETAGSYNAEDRRERHYLLRHDSPIVGHVRDRLDGE